MATGDKHYIGVKSIQRGVITMPNGSTATATINAVDTNKAIVIHCGNFSNNASYDDSIYYECTVELTDETTVTATRYIDDSVSCTVAFEVIEFY